MTNLQGIKTSLCNDHIFCFIKEDKIWFNVNNENDYMIILDTLNINPLNDFTEVCFETVALQDNGQPLFAASQPWFNTIDAERLECLALSVAWNVSASYRPTEVFQVVCDAIDLMCSPDIGNYMSDRFSDMEWNTRNTQYFIEDVCNLLGSHYKTVV